MSVHNLIAHFLKSHQYHDTLRAFEEEHGHPISHDLPTNESLEEIVNDRINFQQLHQKLTDIKIDEHFSLDDDLKAIAAALPKWTSPYPQNDQLILLAATGLVVSCALTESHVLLGTSDMKVILIDLKSGQKTHELVLPLGRVVVKKIVPFSTSIGLIGMNGRMRLLSINDGELSVGDDEFQVHARLITDAVRVLWKGKTYMVSLGWDFLVKVFEVDERLQKVEQKAEYKLSSQGSCVNAVVYGDKIIVVVGKNEFTALEVFSFESLLTLVYKISLNDAEFLLSIFSPRSISIFEHNGTPLVAVGTSHEPYMRLIVVTLKELKEFQEENSDTVPTKRNQIIKNLNTMAPQDKYLSAMIAWRPDGSGVWVMGEDGVVRGIDLVEEKVIVELKAHPRIKTFSVGETVVTCGSDKEVKIWR